MNQKSCTAPRHQLNPGPSPRRARGNRARLSNAHSARGRDLRARDAHVQYAGNEHVEVAAGHLARQPDEGEHGYEGGAREAEAQLEEVVVEKEIVHHGVAEGDQRHQDTESDKLPVFLKPQKVEIINF